MLPWSRFSALFLAFGIGLVEVFNMVPDEPGVMRYATMAAAVLLIAGAALTDGKRNLGLLLAVWSFTAGVFATGVLVVADSQARFVLDQAPAYLPRMILGLALSLAGAATAGVAMARRERSLGGLGLPDDTQYR